MSSRRSKVEGPFNTKAREAIGPHLRNVAEFVELVEAVAGFSSGIDILRSGN